ncbi:alpha/beta fold hydrolase [Xanthomonas sp. BRIP62415]|uniref:thioesterase domain-containing protein n=1 Tax=Xanthomonas sp. BRIP62415 TaxID=2182390 RepID=UPI000F8C6D33|nr:alpha/beta fold hydrolase [Xanthomonas sp. BRIP62415]
MKISAESIATLHSSPARLAAATTYPADVMVRLWGGDQGVPLFLVHPVGGGVGCYLPLVQALKPTYPVYALRHPGLNGESPRQALDDLAQRYLDAILSVQRGQPYRLGGWSLGGVIAALMAARAEALEEPPSLLLVIDSPACAADGSFVHVESSSGPDEDEDHRALLQEMERNAAALHGDHDALAVLRAVLAANAEALSVYRMTATVRAVHYIGAGSDLSDRGWRALASERFERRQCTGNHYSMMDAPHVSMLARHCAEWLAPRTIVTTGDA